MSEANDAAGGDAAGDEARAAAQEAVRRLRRTRSRLDQPSIDVILDDARSHYAWTDRPVARETLEEIYRITANGPTSMNGCPARFVFVTSEDGKARLAKSLKAKNVEKMTSAPVCTIIAHDLHFWERLPYLFPHVSRKCASFAAAARKPR